MLSLLLPLMLLAGAGPATAGAAPAEGRIRCTFEPPAPVKGKDAAVRVVLEVRDAAGAPLVTVSPPRVAVSAGNLGPLQPAGGPGRWEARWEPTTSPQPEVLAVVALSPRCPLCPAPLASGVALLPVSAAVELPGESDPGVATTVEIAGKSWGPVRADARGRFVLPAVVPPGTRWGLATSRSSLGNLRTTKLDLQLPDRPGLLCALWPARLPADGGAGAGLTCVAWSAAGAPLDPAAIRGAAARGEVTRAGADGDAWRARYRPAPGAAAAGATDRIAVELGPARAARSELTLGFAPGPPASIEWSAEGEPALPGSTLAVRARALDSGGTVLGDAIAADGGIADGRLRVRRDFGDGRQPVTLRYRSPAGDAAASLSLHRVGADWVAAVRDVAGRPVEGVELRFGDGTGRRSDARGEARVRASRDEENVVGPDGLRAAASGASTGAPPPIELSRDVVVALRPPGSYDVAARADGKWVRWRVLSPEGGAATGRKVSVVGSGVAVGPVEPDGDGGRCALRGGKGTVAVVDEESGATALVEIR